MEASTSSKEVLKVQQRVAVDLTLLKEVRWKLECRVALFQTRSEPVFAAHGAVITFIDNGLETVVQEFV